MRSIIVGVMLFLVSMLNLDVGMAGLLSLATAYCFAKFINCNKTFLSSGVYTYNALLVGLSIGYMFHFSPLTALLIISTSILTLIISLALNTWLGYHFGLPILSIPFVIVSSIIYLASIQYGNLLVNNLYAHHFSSFMFSLPNWIEGYFIALGAIFFSPYVLAGLLIAIGLACYSRIVFFCLSSASTVAP